MSRSWRLFLNDMIEFSGRVMAYAQGKSCEELEQDSLRYDAVLRNIELIGEAARNIPTNIRAEAPEIPWHDMVRMRNVLSHVYFGVDREVVWNVVSVEVPWLLGRLEKLAQRVAHLPD